MVSAYAHSGAMFFTNGDERDKAFTYSFQLRCVGGIGIFYVFKLFLIGIITRINTHFFYNACSYFGSIGCKMYIGNQRSFIPAFAQFVFYVEQVFGFFNAG